MILFLIIMGRGVYADVSVTLMGGSAYNFSAPMTISQTGYQEIKIDSRWESKSFESPPYYLIRLALRKDQIQWELEFIHHKLYLKNKPSSVQRFSISHGFNLLFVNRSMMFKTLVVRIGAGIVIAHPETEVRLRKFNDDKGLFGLGYTISGPAAQFSIGKYFPLAKGWSLVAEGKLTGSYVRIPISDGYAYLFPCAIHGLLGLEYVF